MKKIGFIDKRLLLIIVLALVVRFPIFPFVAKHEERMFTIYDAYQYDAMARNMTENHMFYHSERVSYASPIYKALTTGTTTPFDAFRPPVYPLFLTGIYSVFGYKPYIAIVIQLLLSSLTCAAVYKIGEALIKKGVGFVAGLLLALDFPTAVYANLLLTETLFTFLFLCTIYFILKFFKEGRRTYLICSGAFLGISALCRPIIQYFIILMVLAFVVVYRKDIKKGILNYFLYLLIFLAAISPWAFRNYMTYGNFKLSTMGGYNLLFYNAAYLESYQKGGHDHLQITREEMVAEADRIFADSGIVSPFEKSKLYQEKALKIIFADPGLYAKIHLIGIAKIFAIPTFPLSERIFGVPLERTLATAVGKGFLTENFGKALRDFIRFFIQNWKALLYLPFLLLYLLFLYLMAGYGLYQIIKKKDLVFTLFLFLLIVIYYVFIVGPAGVARFRIPLMPYIDFIAGYGLFQIILLRKKKVIKEEREAL